MPYDGFIFTDDAPPELKKKKSMEGNILFGSSQWRREPEPKVVYVPYTPKQKQQSMNYPSRPQYSYQRPQKQVGVIKAIGETQKAIQKFSKSRREAKLNESKRLKQEIKERLAILKAEREAAILRKANWALKTAKTRQTVANVKQGAKGFIGAVNERVNRKKMVLPKANLPE